uniref:Uncharacterized protein n=1 Tax=Meloidogyne enterolobii TaxID=390850 RepID=A0A6V7TU52_MELEN|nr:unnamed protein product [Meloidogyne enterolobii]
MDSDYICLGAPAAACNPASHNQQKTTTPDPAGPCCGQAGPTNSADVIQQPNFGQSAYVDLSTRAQPRAENETLYQAKQVPSAPNASFEKQRPHHTTIEKEDKESLVNANLEVQGADPSVRDSDFFTIRCIGYTPLRLVQFGPFTRVYFVRNKKNPSQECIAKVESYNENKRTVGIEARVYLDCKGVRGFAELYDRFRTLNGSRVLLIQRLGTDLKPNQTSSPGSESAACRCSQTLLENVFTYLVTP